MKSFGSPLLPAIIWLIISIILLTLPGNAIPKEDWLDKIWFDKWVHIGMFFIMVFLWSRALLKNKKKDNKKTTLILLFISTLLYGYGMELVQKYFIENRSFDWGDVAADSAGSILGLFYFWVRLKK